METEIRTTESVFRSQVKWGAIIAGWLFAYAFALLLYLLGAAVGFTSLASINRMSAGVTVGTGVWMIAAWVISTFVGAIFAARLSGFSHRGVGAMHGLLVWALSGIMTLFIGSVQAATIASTGIATGQGVIEAGRQAGTEIEIPDEIQASFEQETKEQASRIVAEMPAAANVNQEKIQTALEQMDTETMTSLGAALIRGDVQGAKDTLTRDTDLSQKEVDSLANALATRAQEYKGRVKEEAGSAVEQAGDISSVVLWLLFLSSLMGLGAGAWGGSVGASMVAKSYIEPHEDVIPGDIYTPEQKRKIG